MPKKIEEKIHIVSPTRAYLQPIGVMGPIVHPLQVNKIAAVQLLMNGAEVYEYLPQTKNTIRLTLANINDNNRHTEVSLEVIPEVAAVNPIIRTGVPNIPQQPQEEVAENVKTEEDIEEKEEMDQPEEITAESEDPFIFQYNEDGTVDESKIEWSKYSKNQRKAIRAKITEHNNSLNN